MRHGIPGTLAALGMTILAAQVLAQPEIDTGFEGVRFGATSAELLQRFGTRAMRLERPLDFGDAYVDVVLRNYALGGYAWIVYFQIDRASRRLRRIQIERPRHGAVPMVHEALITALTERLGPPARVCSGYEDRPDPQAIDERIWRRDGVVVRAVFRSINPGVLEWRRSTIDNGEVWDPAMEGKPQQLFVRFAPAGTEPDGCGSVR
jgi:hypothetical protein